MKTLDTEEIVKELGRSCEYGCKARCESLEHWKWRASYLWVVTEARADRIDALLAKRRAA